MRITLYKGCILSNRYNIVYDLTSTKTFPNIAGITRKTSALEDYLKSLPQNTIELPNTYYTRNMSITLNISGNSKFKDAFSYNYCYITTDDGLERYCFITSIELGNTVATFYTEEDIWSTYGTLSHIKLGYLTNTYQRDFKSGLGLDRHIDYYLLPTAFQSNDEPTVKSAHRISGGFNIVAQMQLYNLDKDGKVSNRVVRTVVFTTFEKIGETYEVKPASFSTDEITKIIGGLQVYGPAGDLLHGPNGAALSYYQIDNITVLPEELNIGKCFENKTIEKIKAATVGISFSIRLAEDLFIGFCNFPKLFYISSEIQGRMKDLYNGILDNNFKIISFGTRSSQYEINMNGTSLKYSLKASASDWDFKLILSFQQKTIDITNDFVLKVPFDSITGDVLAQRKIAKNTAIYNGVTSIIGGVAKIGTSAASIATGGITEVTKIRHSRTTGKVTSRKTTSSGVRSDNGAGIIGGAIDVADGIVAIVNANTPRYTSNRGTFVQSEGLYNASYGLCYQEVIPDNEAFVNNMTALCGYIVYEIITRSDEIIFGQTFEDGANVLKFESVVLDGGYFPLDIREKLEAILENGFIIYY